MAAKCSFIHVIHYLTTEQVSRALVYLQQVADEKARTTVMTSHWFAMCFHAISAKISNFHHSSRLMPTFLFVRAQVAQIKYASNLLNLALEPCQGVVITNVCKPAGRMVRETAFSNVLFSLNNVCKSTEKLGTRSRILDFK